MIKQAIFVTMALIPIAAVSIVHSAPQNPVVENSPGNKKIEAGDRINLAAGMKSIAFEAVSTPVTDAEKRNVVTSLTVSIEGQEYPIGYHLIARSGQKIGSEIFGLLVDQNGQALTGRKGKKLVSPNADFTSILQKGKNFFSITHFESIPGAMYLTSLTKNNAGLFKAVKTRNIDFSSVGGVWGPCAGIVTPWNTHLGGEESPPNGRAVYAWKEMKHIRKLSSRMLRYFGIDRNAPGMTMERVLSVFNPYRYGFPVEVDVDESGITSVKKHYAMGRMSLELAYVMPDRRTVYMSDDGINGGFHMFIADRKNDLSSGTLYAAKWIQKDDKKGGRADLNWISLGHASHDEVLKGIQRRIRFSEMFEVYDRKGDEACPPGLTGIAGGECLRLKPGMAMLASRLETSRYAAYMGATSEFSKSEGVTFDPISNQLFVAISAVSRSMEDYKRKGKPNRKYDRGGPNDIRLPYNSCGVVYSLNVGRDKKFGSDYVAKTMRALVVGEMKSYSKDSGLKRNSCAVDNIANPDNLTFMHGYGTLIISEDSGSGHQNDAVWAFDLKTRKLTRIQTTPYGSEATSPYWYPNLDGRGYLMSVIQHPYGESDRKFQKFPEESAAYIGYIGPFPN